MDYMKHIKAHVVRSFSDMALDIEQYDDVEQRIYFTIIRDGQICEMQARLVEGWWPGEDPASIEVEILVGEDWYHYHSAEINV